MSIPIPSEMGDFDDLLQRALEILEEIRGRNHSQMVNESAEELEMAKECEFKYFTVLFHYHCAINNDSWHLIRFPT